MIKVYAGIDPGATGAISSIIYDGTKIVDYSVQEFKHSGIDGYITYLKDLQHYFNIQKLVVESVHSMPGQGVSSTFTFGTRFGEILGVLKALGIGYELISPQKWQKEIGAIKPASTKADKKKTISEKIIAMYPETGSLIRGPRAGYKDGVGDAFGLAHYAFKIYK